LCGANAEEGRMTKQQATEITRIKKTLGTLIAWLPQSANSPIRIDEAERLLRMLEGKRE